MNDQPSIETQSEQPNSISTPIDMSRKTFAEILGEVVWLISQDSEIRDRPIGSLARDVMPALVNKSFKLYYNNHDSSLVGHGAGGSTRPVAFVAWITASDAFRSELVTDPTRLMRVSASDWTLDGTPIIILCVTPFGAREDILRDVNRHLVQSHL